MYFKAAKKTNSERYKSNKTFIGIELSLKGNYYERNKK